MTDQAEAPPPTPASQLQDIAHRIATCQQCPLHRTRNHTVPGVGNPEADIMLIGEGPGRQEDQLGIPFVGASGKYLDQLLNSAGIKRDSIFLTNVVKCRPPENSTPDLDHIAACRPWLDQQMAVVQPKLIVLMGNSALQQFRTNAMITQSRGRIQIHSEGYATLPTFHPASGLHQPSRRQLIDQDFASIPHWFGILTASPDETEPPAAVSVPQPQTPAILDILLLQLDQQMSQVHQKDGDAADPRQARHRLNLLAYFAKALSENIDRDTGHPHTPWRRQALGQTIRAGQALNEHIPQICRNCLEPFYGNTPDYRPQRYCAQCQD